MWIWYLGREQRVGIEPLHVADQLVSRVHNVVHKRPAEQEPIGSSVHGHALRDLAVSQTPHVGVALVEDSVQTLFADETGK